MKHMILAAALVLSASAFAQEGEAPAPTNTPAAEAAQPAPAKEAKEVKATKHTAKHAKKAHHKMNKKAKKDSAGM